MLHFKTNSIAKKEPVIILLISIFLSCTLLICINYFTIKILSANRAYVNGESNYSKAQKDAVRYLITYLYTEEESNYVLFKKELSVPQGDREARIELSGKQNNTKIKNGFIKGGNSEKDVDDLVWLFKNFHSIPFFKKAINEWKNGDSLVNQINHLADSIHLKIDQTTLNQSAKHQLLSQIGSISNQLSRNEKNFSNTLGEGTREVKQVLIFANIVLILVIIGSVSIYYSITVKKILSSQLEIEKKNHDLQIANKELDKFVYSASHDLRAPITSLKGLLQIIKNETNPEQVKIYLDLMDTVLTQQDQFIFDIIDYSRNNRRKIVFETVNLNTLIDNAITQHQYMECTNHITITKELGVETCYSDALRLKIIVNNLLSNAIKYRDEHKSLTEIVIKTYVQNQWCCLEITDNGIGIEAQNTPRIFEMFFATDNNKGTGLGLYITKEAVENIGGTITVASEINIGTTFTIKIPHHDTF